LRRFLLLTFACSILSIATCALAQQLDVAVGGSTVVSSKPTISSQAYLPPGLRGGVYPSGSFQYIFKGPFGFSAELVTRDKKALYNGYQFFRPVLYNVNAAYTRPVRAKTHVDVMAGVGASTFLFYTQYVNCPVGNCPNLANSTHFTIHAGFDARYYFWRNFFARPEVHYYRIVNNNQFHSGNLLRLGVSVGYSFGR
jgi:hypothetical protein